MKKLFAAVALATILMGCGPSLDAGTVVDKDHTSAWTQWVLSGKVMVPISHPEKGVLTLEDCSQGTECLRDRRSVRASFYETVEIGQYVELGGSS